MYSRELRFEARARSFIDKMCNEIQNTIDNFVENRAEVIILKPQLFKTPSIKMRAEKFNNELNYRKFA